MKKTFKLAEKIVSNFPHFCKSLNAPHYLYERLHFLNLCPFLFFLWALKLLQHKEHYMLLSPFAFLFLIKNFHCHSLLKNSGNRL